MKVSSTHTYMMSIAMLSLIAVMLCFGLINIRHCQKFTRASTNWIAGCIWPVARSLDTPGVKLELVQVIGFPFFFSALSGKLPCANSLTDVRLLHT